MCFWTIINFYISSQPNVCDVDVMRVWLGKEVSESLTYKARPEKFFSLEENGHEISKVIEAKILTNRY